MISGIDTPVVAAAEKMRPATPGTPSMPRPDRVTNCRPRRAAMALTVPWPLLLLPATRRVPG